MRAHFVWMYSFVIAGCACGALVAGAPEPLAIKLMPTEVTLRGADASQTFLVMATETMGPATETTTARVYTRTRNTEQRGAQHPVAESNVLRAGCRGGPFVWD